jgi:hypothetical protein
MGVQGVAGVQDWGVVKLATFSVARAEGGRAEWNTRAKAQATDAVYSAVASGLPHHRSPCE